MEVLSEIFVILLAGRIFFRYNDTNITSWRMQMNFFKENSSMITRLIITHIGMAAFGAVMFLSTNQKGDGMMLAASIFSAIFYAIIVYCTMWEYGSKDKPAIDAGRMQCKSSRGFLVSLTAEAIAMLLVVLFLVCSFMKETSTIAAEIYGSCYIILTLLDSCFTGIVIFLRHKMDSAVLIALVYLLGSVAISIASMLGYLAGTKDIRIIPQRSYTNKK